MKIIVFTILFSLISSSAMNQTGGDSAGLMKFLESKTKEEDPAVIKESSNDSLLNKTISEYNIFAFKHRINAYKWQLFSSKIIFFMVILIVLAGLYLSYLQFDIGRSIVKKRISGKASQPLDPGLSELIKTQTSFEVSKTGLKIDSAVIGLLILIVSIVFFFLYLKYVFHISE